MSACSDTMITTRALHGTFKTLRIIVTGSVSVARKLLGPWYRGMAGRTLLYARKGHLRLLKVGRIYRLSVLGIVVRMSVGLLICHWVGRR